MSINDEQHAEQSFEKSEATPDSPFFKSSIVLDENTTAVLIEKLLNNMKKSPVFNFFERIEQIFSKIGLFGLYVLAVAGLMGSVILSLRFEIPFGYSVGFGLAWFFTCISGHYIAWKFLPALSNVIKANPTRLCSRAFLDSLALSTGVAGCFSLMGGCYVWAKTSSTDALVLGLALFIICEYLFSICLNPSCLNIVISEKATAGEEFIGLFSLFMKCFVKLIPVAFGASIALGFITMAEALLIDKNLVSIIGKLPLFLGFTGMSLLPALGYIVFLQYYFLMDIALSILSLPARFKS